jgi:hypothetical protein
MNIRRLFVALIALVSLHGPRLSASAQSTPPSDIPALLQSLIDSDEVQRTQIMEQLDLIQDPNVLVPPVLAALETVDPRQAWRLLDILARFPGSAKPEPIIRLAHRSGEISYTLKTQLVSLGDPSRPALLKAIADACVTWKPEPPSTDSQSRQESSEPDAEIVQSQYFIHWASGALAEINPEGRNALLEMLRSSNACQRSAAQAGLTDYVLGASRTLDPSVVKGLKAGLNASDPAVQKTSVLIVEPMIGYGRAKLSPEMTKSLFAILKAHPDREARRAAFDMLRHAGGDIPKKAAEIASHDLDENIQNSATDFLENPPDPRLM